MPGGASASTAGRDEPAQLVDLAHALAAAASVPELERAFHARAPALLGMPMRGFYLLDDSGTRAETISVANVSDSFVARYERAARPVDPLLRRALADGAPVYNLAVMSLAEWTASDCYRAAAQMHRMTHVVQAPIVAGGRQLGTLNAADDDGARTVTAAQLERIGRVARLLGSAALALRARERATARADQLRGALDLSPAALAIVDPVAPEPLLNRAARELLERLGADEELLWRLTARPARDGEAFTREAEVALPGGGRATVRAHVRAVGGDGALAASLTVEGEPGAAAAPAPSWALLTGRERDVARLIAEGLSDREIAARLVLSPYTVRQHAKRIYRKLGVSSRVQLARLALGAAPS